MALQERVTQAFEASFGCAPSAVVRAPGRVNLIGEHTDYNDGFVMPIAIDRAVWIAIGPVIDDRVRVRSLDFESTEEFALSSVTELPDTPGTTWIDYVQGTVWALQSDGLALSGWQGVMAGDVPVGAGLSSSAAVELAVARACATMSDLEWDAAQMALRGQRAENRWVGVNCGIMDQMISAAGAAGQALLLDCRSLAGDLVPLPESTSIIVLDTGTRRGLVDSAYNERRAQCEAAAAHFGIRALRDVDLSAFEARAHELDEVTGRRARHVISENERTTAAAAAMRAGDRAALGQLMDASHVSLRDDFEVSSESLDLIVECARPVDGCLGARMTGA
ncbi:MAG: galactokinase, partial [Gemmatimonadetes bacterium]|nr:galactokinase [Gemmatimonadota bacterium]